MTRYLGSRWLVLAVLASGACGDGIGPAPLPPPPVVSPPPAPPPPPDPVGRYTLTLDVGSGCDVIPEAARTRTYTADITSREAGYLVTLSGATFPQAGICNLDPWLYCNQFLATREGDLVQFDLRPDEEGYGGIVEQLSSETSLHITGFADGRLEGSTLDASGTGDVSYCIGCGNSGARSLQCRSNDMRLRFTRR